MLHMVGHVVIAVLVIEVVKVEINRIAAYSVVKVI